MPRWWSGSRPDELLSRVLRADRAALRKRTGAHFARKRSGQRLPENMTSPGGPMVNM